MRTNPTRRTLVKGGTALATSGALIDMFANYCAKRQDAKNAIKITERQLQRIYR